MKGLESFVLRGVHWEIMLTQLRKELCLLNGNKSKDIHKYKPLINALAHQTFLNEYAFYYEQQEADYSIETKFFGGELIFIFFNMPKVHY